MVKTALITGITGQDGPILARLLLNKGYEVHGLRPYTPDALDDHLAELTAQGLILHYGDLLDSASLMHVLNKCQPHEIYNLAGLSHVGVSFFQPEVTANVNGLGVVRLLEAIRQCGLMESVKFYQAGSSEMFGGSPAPQTENTRFHPRSPYAVAKVFAHYTVTSYREAYGLFACNGILFNHESPLRGEEFVTRKITKAVRAIEAGHQNILLLGNLDARRDWGHADDYMRGAWMMLQQDMPDDYILATGVSHTVRDFTERAFDRIGVTLHWEGQGLNEKGIDEQSGHTLVCVDEAFFRPNEVDILCGEAGKAREVIGWKPQKSFEDLIDDMMNADREIAAWPRLAHSH